MTRLLDDYRFDEHMRYEKHKLLYALHDEQYSLSGVFAAAVLSALLVDTPEGDKREIAIETPEQREAWFARYEREVRRDNGGLFDNEVQSLSEAYVELSATKDIFATLGCNERLLDLAFQLTIEYMQRLVLELVGKHIYDVCPWQAPFAQWLYDAGFVETRRQRLLTINWEEPGDVYDFAQSIQEPTTEVLPTFVFDGISAKDLITKYYDWLWQSAQKEAELFPDATVQLAEIKQTILEQETDDAFLWPELKKLPQQHINLFKKWMTEWKDYITQQIVLNPVPTKKSNMQQELFLDEVLPIPQQNSYAAVREYIRERSKYDPEFKKYCKNVNHPKLCHQLTLMFGWAVDPNSLRKSMNRKLKIRPKQYLK